MTPLTEKQSLALIGALIATVLVASMESLMAWVMTTIVGFGSTVLLRHSWSQLASTATWRYQQERVKCVSALRQRSTAATTLVRSEWRRRRHARDLGWMSDQWLDEHRAANR